MKSVSIASVILASSISSVSGYAFVPQRTATTTSSSSSTSTITKRPSSSSLQMVDQNVIMGAGVALAGIGAGIGLVAFTENQGERAKERGSELSEGMATKIAGKLMEDVEVSSVSDLGSLTSQLENALKESGGVDNEKMQEIELTEEEKDKIKQDADD